MPDERCCPSPSAWSTNWAARCANWPAANTPHARVLRVGVTPLIASSILPQVLRACSEAQPEWRVEVADMDRSLIQQGVEDGTLDAGFGAFFQKTAGLRRRRLFPAELVLAQSAEHAARTRRAPLPLATPGPRQPHRAASPAIPSSS
jgi:DNA-binding transcriptional LysR family regulator